MSDHSRDNPTSPDLLTLGVIAVLMSQLSSLHPRVAGLSTFLALAVLMALVALRGEPRATALLCGIAALLGTGACWFFGSDVSVSITVIVSAIGSCTLATLSWLICTASRRRQRQIAGLESQQTDLVRKLYEYDRGSTSGKIPLRALSSPVGTSNEVVSAEQILSDSIGGTEALRGDHEFFDFALLLLSMQQIGQRLSSQLDLRSLVTTIQDTAKEVLHCGHAELYLWNARRNRLEKAVFGRSSGDFSMSPDEFGASPVSNAAFDWVMANRRILTRRDLVSGKLPPTTPHVSAETPMATAVAPLLIGNELVGLLEIDDVVDESSTFVRMLFILSSHCALGVKNAQLFRHIEEMARRDSLTRLLNHAAFLNELERLIDDAQANHQTLTVVMSDVDHFKNVNDDYGHQAGDKVLQDIANWWRTIMPEHAVLARYGGEEFICALPGEDLKRGFDLAELLRSSLAAHPISHDGQQLPVTASFGVAELGKPATSATRLVRLADKALYRAKAAGRNRTECHDPIRPEIAAMIETAQFTLPKEPPVVNF